MLKKLFKQILASFNLAVMKKSSYVLLSESFKDWGTLEELSNEQLSLLLKWKEKSHAQLKQDLFVLLELNFKREGFFVEFGATNGKDLSNTMMLERDFDWNGILAEPAKVWHKDLRENRKASIETACVWSESGKELMFNEVNESELSTVSDYSSSDLHNESRKDGKMYTVETISLLDLLIKHNAPKEIDYLSIDTEGSEFEILNAFDFSKYNIKVISCEHNKTENRHKIYQLLTSKGYKRKFAGLSNYDDWYVKIN